VTGLDFNDNQDVRAGQLLVEIDPRDFEVRLKQAEAQRLQAAAQLEQSRAQLALQQAQLDQAQANARVAEAELSQAQSDLARFRAVDQRAVSRQQIDSVSATAKSSQARLDASRQAVAGARAQIVAQAAQVGAAAANLELADVAIANAQLQLSYTRLAAPVDGRVTKRTVEVGNYINPGQALLAVVSPAMWVTANFKETQLALMHPGQHVRVRVDACPGLDLDAHVDSFQAGSGSVFSSLPAENATGNYVKVVQRVPVKIVFDGLLPTNCRIAPGLSVAPRVTVR
jgi:membrane fusion protein (multidrug efflux system)